MTSAAEFTITRVLDAPRSLVWRAWTEEEELAHWLHPFDVSTDSISFDVQVGGRLAYTMTDEQTGQTFPTGGVFLEVQPMDRLAFTWGDPQDSVESAPVITLTFTERGEQTELVLHLRGIAGEPGDGFVYDGCDEALTNFALHVEGLSRG